jgi:hypothetical protein
MATLSDAPFQTCQVIEIESKLIFSSKWIYTGA